MVERGDSPREVRSTRALVFTAVAPLLIVFAGSLWTIVGWAAGASPFWPEPMLTISEAAALANAGEVVRLIEVEHQDPNRAWPIREGILGAARMMTPLEAAVAIRRAQMVYVLLREGASPGPARTTLICRAEASGAADVVELLLQTADGSDPRSGCQPLSADYSRVHLCRAWRDCGDQAHLIRLTAREDSGDPLDSGI